MEQDKLNNRIKEAIEEIKEIKMTSLEKRSMIDSILGSSAENAKPVSSPYMIYSFFSVITKKRLVYSASVFCLIIMLSGGAVFASGDSLPGNILYPLKVKVVEPARGALIFSPLAKVEYENNLATKRLMEAEVLANEDRLDSSKEEELNSLLENHTIAFNEAVDKFYKSRKPEEILNENEEAINTFQISMNAHARVLDIIVSDKYIVDDASLETETKISKTAKESARKIKDKQKERQVGKKSYEIDEYKERKETVRSLIDKTTDDLKKTNTKNSKRRQSVVDGATKTLLDARKLLEESDEDESKGDSQNAVDKILDSENSVKEADIFLKTGLGL